jgi:hypothetical protein
MKFYTGVGSRKTPPEILKLISSVATKLADLGYTLRSGGASGADSAFEFGAVKNVNIFYASDSTTEAQTIAAKFHPAWDRCSEFARKLHGRNAFQVLGRDLKTPSSFLICWTPDGCTDHKSRSIRTGGTGTAISIASHHKIPVFNLAREDHRKRIEKFLASN